MRVFNALVFDAAIQDTGVYFTDAEWNTQLGRPDRFWISAVTTQVAPGSPTLTVLAQTSANELDWTNLSPSADINRQPISTSGKTLLLSPQVTNTAGFVRLYITLDVGGAAYVRVWITGRDSGR